jgi:cytochrome c heme-lyase
MKPSLKLFVQNTNSTPHNMGKETEAPAEVCPVDPATRAAWLKSNPGRSRPEVFPGATAPTTKTTEASSNSCDSSTIDQSTSTIPAPAPARGFFSRFTSSSPAVAEPPSPKSLGLDREISTIPRASPVNNEAGSKPANSEQESGASKSGNWVYPSEKMFFEAMKRKGYNSDAKDMKTIVPIHNAVNERAWKEIKEWERPWGSEQKCVTPLPSSIYTDEGKIVANE